MIRGLGEDLHIAGLTRQRAARRGQHTRLIADGRGWHRMPGQRRHTGARGRPLTAQYHTLEDWGGETADASEGDVDLGRLVVHRRHLDRHRLHPVETRLHRHQMQRAWRDRDRHKHLIRGGIPAHLLHLTRQGRGGTVQPARERGGVRTQTDTIDRDIRESRSAADSECAHQVSPRL